MLRSVVRPTNHGPTNHRSPRRAAASAMAAFVVAVPVIAAGASSTAATAAGAAACSANTKAFSGYVASTAGPLAHASVEVYADPDLSRLKVGQSAGLLKLGDAETNAAGCFAVLTAASWSKAAQAGGTLDLRVMIRRPESVELRVVPVLVVRGTGKSPARPRVKAVDSGGSAASSRASGTGAVLESFTGTETVQPQVAASVGTAGAGPSMRHAAPTAQPASAFLPVERAAAAPGKLRWVKKADYGKRPVLVGQWWSTNPGTVQRWTYSKGASSSLESAYSLSGEGGGYSHSETTSKETTSTVGFPQAKGRSGQYYQTYFGYGKYHLQQNDYITGDWTYIGTWVRTTSWERGTQVIKKVSVPATKDVNCSKYIKGSDDTTEVSKAITWTDGVSLSATMKGVLGSVTLSSQTGFTSKATNAVEFKTRRGRLCGVYGPLSKRPGMLVARK